MFVGFLLLPKTKPFYASFARRSAARISAFLLYQSRETVRSCPTVPYRFEGELTLRWAQWGVSLVCKSMMRAVFASVMGKFGSPKNKLPSRHQSRDSHRSALRGVTTGRPTTDTSSDT